MDDAVAKCVLSTEAHGDRMLLVKIQARPTNIVVIQVYMPTSAHDDSEVELMYEKLEEMIKKQKGTDYLVVMGDWNAVVGEGEPDECVGQYGLGVRNNRGERLVEFCKQQQMLVTNTCFKQDKRRRYTWKAPGDTGRYQLDYVLVKRRFRNSVNNSHAYPGADADTDHNLIIMTAFLALKNVKCRKTRKRWDREKLSSCAVEFSQEIDRNLKVCKSDSTNERWKELKKTMEAQARKIIGYRKGITAKKPWITGEMMQKMEERRKVKHQSTEQAKKEYRRLNNELRRETEKARECWWRKQCEELEELQRKGMHGKVYTKIRKLQENRGKSNTAINDKQGKLLTEGREVRNRWKEYIEELYDTENAPTENDMSGKPSTEDADDLGPSLLREEIEQAIKEMKTGKAEGIDNIPVEMIQNLGEKAKAELVKLCQQIYTSGEWPQDFMKTVIIPLQKKPNATDCSDHRTISLISHAAKILLKIITKRLESKVQAVNFLGQDQFGFRKGRGTREAIAALRSMGERSLENGNDLFVCYVDYEKAFDRVNWCKLMRVLEKLGVDERDRQLIKNLYLGQSVVIRIAGEDSDPAKLGRGVRQGCPLSPLLFNIYIQALIDEAMDGGEDGVKVGGQLVKAIRFADDQAMLASSNAGLQRIMNRLNETSGEYGMKINIAKTKVMRISRTGGKSVDITVNGVKLEQVKQYCYLGSMIAEDCKCQIEIRRRIAMGKEAFNKRGELLRGKLNHDLKKRLVKTLVWSVVLYASETWTMQKEDVKRLEAFEMWIWRRMEKITWKEHITNEDVLRRVQEERLLIDTIRKRQKSWFGHILRGESLLRTVIEGRMIGKKVAGRPRMKMIDWMMDKSAERNYEQLKAMARNRQEWQRWNPGPV